MISLLIAIPLLGAFTSIIWKKVTDVLLIITPIINLSILAILRPTLVEHLGGWKAPFGIPLVLDNASYITLFIINSIFLLLSLNRNLFDLNYGTVLLVLLTSTNGLILTGDLFNSFVFLEITAVSSYILAYHNKNPYGAYKYLIIGSVAGAFYLLSTILAYVNTGSLNMAHVSQTLNSSVIPAIALLYIVGLGVEAKLFPLAGWVPDVYASGSPMTPVILGSMVTFTIMYLVGRIFLSVLHGSFLNVLYILGLITVVFGEISALRQNDLLRALAYSSVAQAGLVISAISLKTSEAITAGYFHSLNDVTAKLILFPVAVLLSKGFGKNKIPGIAFSIASFSVIGFPLFAGFRSKLLILLSAFSKGDYVLPAVLLFAGVVEVAYFIRWNVRLWHESEGEECEMKKHTQFILLALSLFIIYIGLFPDLYLSASEKIAKSLLNVSSYIEAVLGGM